MKILKLHVRISFLMVLLLPSFLNSSSQGRFDNSTRALYIFDIARYVDYGTKINGLEYFKIGVLADDSLMLAMGELRRTRPQLKGKPVDLVYFREESQIVPTQILYLNKNSGLDIKKVKEMIKGQQTLLVTEGYDFNESMVNFVVVKGVPQIEAHDDKIREAGMVVDEVFLFMAVKTKEDWENLFDKAQVEIEVQKQQIREQQEMIARQKAEILVQKALLDSLDAQITEKEAILNDKQKQLDYQLSQINKQGKEIAGQRILIAEQQKAVADQKAVLDTQRAEMDAQMVRLNEQIALITQQEEKIKTQLATLEKQKLIMYFILFVLLLFIFLAYNIYRNYRIKKEANIRLEEKNRTISAQKDEIEKQRDVAAMQRDQIAYQKKHITDSIVYAKRIQTALLPSLELFSSDLEHFVLYKPLDIVSGDFYWVTRQDNLQVIIAADSTGHGVPGAFMSMLGVTMLNELVLAKKIYMPDQILNGLRNQIISTLKQTGAEDNVKDGMDVAACVIDFNTSTLYFAGANNPLYLVRDKELVHYRPDKMPAAIHYTMNDFTLHKIDLKKGDCFYIFSDGYADQFGGPDQRKFMTKQLKEVLVSISHMPMIDQGTRLSELFTAWQGDSHQVDDVTVIGVRF